MAPRTHECTKNIDRHQVDFRRLYSGVPPPSACQSAPLFPEKLMIIFLYVFRTFLYKKKTETPKHSCAAEKVGLVLEGCSRPSCGAMSA